MKYLLILIVSFIFLCTNSIDPPIKTTLDVYAGDDITVSKNDTINFSGIYTTNADIEIFRWYVLRNTVNATRLSISQTHQLQYVAPDCICTLSFIFQAKTVNNVVDEDTVIAYVIPNPVLTVNAGQDQTVLVDLPVVLHATYTGENIINSFWKIGSDNFVPASPETTFTAPKTPLRLPCIFKVTTSDNREVADTVNFNVISLDSLRVVAVAGNDTSTDAGSQMTLNGTYKGKNIAHTFWKIGNGDFTPAPLDTTITLPDTPSIIKCILKVGNAFMEALDTVKIKVLPAVPLSALAFEDTIVQAGSPLKIHGSYKGNVHKIYWKIGSGPFAHSPPETTITVPDTAISLICIFKVQDFKLNEAVDTTIVTVIDTNAVYAHVGNDTTVDISSSLKLSGSYTGNVVATFWKIGASIFVPASPETTIIVPSTPVLLPCIFRVVGARSKSDEDTLNVKVVVSDTATAMASAGKDTIVPVNSLVKFNGSYAGTNVKETFWNINNAGFVRSSPDTSIRTPSSPAVWMCIFKTVTSGQKTDQDTMYLTTVTTTLLANAGDDKNVTVDSTVQLTGTGKDTIYHNNAIVKYEWKYGIGSWIESANGTGIFNPPNRPGSIICSLRVTAQDGQTATDFCIINVFSTSTNNYGKWNHSQEIVLNTTSGGADVSEDVLNFPVLVRLNPGNFNYFSQTLAGGADIRFAKTDGTRLSYEIERWVDNAGDVDTAEIWVKLDTVYGDNSTQKFYMYWGRSDAAGSSNAPAVFGIENNFSAAWHLNEDGDETALDATSANNDGAAKGFTTTSAVSGVIGIAREFDGSDDYFQINNNILEDVLSSGNEKTTLSFWVKADNTDYAKILIWEGKKNANGCGPEQELHLFFGALESGSGIDDHIALYFGDNDDYAGKGDMVHASKAYRDTENWHYVAVSVDNSRGNSETAILYVDGVPVDKSTGKVNANFKGWNTNTRIGRPGADMRYFDGIMDEVRIANDLRSEHWIKLCYENQKSGQTLVSLIYVKSQDLFN